MDDVVAMVEQGDTLEKIMAATGLRKIAVLRCCGEHGLLDTLRANGVMPRTRERREMPEMQRVSDARLRELVASGLRMKQIAIDHGITRQAVSQRLHRIGVKIPPRQPKVKLSKRYGLPMDVLRHLWVVGATRAFAAQKRNAAHRSIGWELTLAQWWEIWEQSGKWEQRGRYKGGYVMGRHGDAGPYAVGNVVICSHSENAIEREKHTPAFRRLPKSQETRLDMR